MEIMGNAYMTFEDKIRVDANIIVVSLWNAYIKEAKDKENFISLNNKEFFENSFNNSYDAAWAVSLSDKWCWSDEYVVFGDDGYLTSFSHWDDEKSPIDPNKIGICHLIDGLEK